MVPAERCQSCKLRSSLSTRVRPVQVASLPPHQHSTVLSALSRPQAQLAHWLTATWE